MQDKKQETKNFETLSLLKDLIFKSKYIIFFSFFVCINQTYAQKLEIGTGAGVIQYKGDLYTSYRPFSGNAGANIFVRYNLSRAVSIKASGMIGNASAKDSKIDNPLNKARDFSFISHLSEASLLVEYNFLNFRTNASRIRSNWTPYVFAGLGMYQNLPNSKIYGDNIDLLSPPPPPPPPPPSATPTPINRNSNKKKRVCYTIWYWIQKNIGK